MRRFFSLIVTALVFCASAFAQSNTIKMTLIDSSNDEGLPFATVSLTPKGAEKATKYVLSSENGEAKIEGVKKGEYTVKAELMGYKDWTKEIKVEGPVDLGTVKVDPDARMLEAASVSAVGNPIVVKKDTIEYNASSFRTTENDMLEDLLKKLPGVEVNSDGSVTANGQTITKITIDGKTFFLDDPSLASKNIPAKIVNKVKVVEKKSDQAAFTGIDDGEEETIIDLSLKPGMMKGWFGNVQGGGGHDIQYVGKPYTQPARWQGSAMIGRFTDKSQISIILNGNNTNNRGFNDLAGSMMRSMRGGGGGMGGGMGGGRGGWGGSNGVTTSWMGGINGAFTLCDGDMDLSANYLYNGSNNVLTEQSIKDTYLDDGSVLRYKKGGPFDLQGREGDGGYGLNRTFSQGHRFGIRLEHKFSENTSIMFEPQVNFGTGRFNEFSSDTTYMNNELMNKGFTSSNGGNKNWTTSGRLLFRQKLGKPGRTISAFVRYSFSGNKLDGFNQSLSETLDGGSWGGDPTNQRYHSVTNSYSVNTRVSYTEPLKEWLFLEVYGSYGWNRNKNVKDTYDSGVFDPTDFAHTLVYNRDGEVRNSIYSKDINNTYHNITTGANLQFQKDKLRAQIGASYQPTITDNITNGETYHSLVHKWSPQAMISYDINDNTDFRIFYRGRSGQPTTSQLMPVPDNSNPLNLSFGNPYLKPYFNHNIRGMFGHTNKTNFFSIRGHISASIAQDGITNATWYDDKGVQYAMPMNGPLSGNFNFGCFLNAPIAKSNFSISNMMNIGFNSSMSYVGKTAKSSEFTARYYNPETALFDYEAFNRDFFEKGHSEDIEDFFLLNKTRSLNVTERLRATYRNDFVEVNISGRTSFNKPWYTIESATKKMTWNNQVQGAMIWTIPSGTGINVDCSYNWYNGYTTPQKSEVLLNAEITQLFLDNKLTLSLKCFDILNQSRNHFVTDTANYHQETLNNTLGRYILLSLTYRFGNFGNAGKQMQSGSQQRGGRGGYGGFGRMF